MPAMDALDLDDDFWEGLSIKNKKRAENKEQQVRALLDRIDVLEAEKQQLQSVSSDLSRAKVQLQDACKQHQSEVEALKQQLSQAQQDLQRTQSSSSSSNNNAAADAADALREASAAAQAQLSRAKQEQQQLSSQLEQAKKEKAKLLASMQQLLKLNQELQHKLEAERQQKEQGAAGKRGPNEPPQTCTPPQAGVRPAEADAAGAQPQAAQQPEQQPPPQQKQQQRKAPQKRKRGGAAAAAAAAADPPSTAAPARKKGRTAAAAAAGAAASAAAAQEAAAARSTATAAAAAQKAAEQLKHMQEEAAKRAEQIRQQQAAAAEAARKRAEAAARKNEQQRQKAAAAAAAAEAAARKQAEEALRQLRQQAAAAAAAEGAAAAGRAPQIELSAPQPDLDSLSASGLKDFLKQAAVDAAAMRGLLEKPDLLRVAKAHMQLWECRRINLCADVAARDATLKLYSAVCVFRVAVAPGQDLCSAVRAVRDSLKRTWQRLALQVHPDKASNGLSAYKPVFDSAFKAVTAAHETLTAAAEGKLDGAQQQQAPPPQRQAQQQQYAQQQQQAQQQYAGFGMPGFGTAGAAGGFPFGFAGFAAFPNGFAGFNPGGVPVYWQ